MKETNYMESIKVKDIYNNLQQGKRYGKTVNTLNKAIGDTIFFEVLSVSQNGEFIRWTHGGSSANKNTVSELKWILGTIFKMTPTEFANTYELTQ